MANTKGLAHHTVTTGDVAVSGLLSGVAAGIIMALYLLAAGLASGEGAATILGRFDPMYQGAPLTGALMHLAVSGVYGALFGLGWALAPRAWRRPVPTLFMAVAYALAMFLLAQLIILPGTNSPLLHVPALHLAVAHAVYGLVLGALIHRAGRG